jgi:glycosyltransferase involved in cell wall biosynthesis
VDFSVPVSSPAIGGNLGRNSILYIGKLLWSKGLRELIDAFSLLRMRPGADALVLQIVGHGADAEAIRAYAKEQGLEHCTRFYGWVDESGAVEQLWREALLLIVPSNSSEGVPRVIDEAMYHHVPVVATRVGGIPLEFKAGEVVLVDPGCPSSLADAAHSVLADKELAQRIERATSLRCEGFKAYGTAGAQHGLLLSQHQQRIPTAASSGAASLDGATV